MYEAIVKVPRPVAAIRMAKRRFRVEVNVLERDPRDGLTEIAIEGTTRKSVLVYMVSYLGWNRIEANERIKCLRRASPKVSTRAIVKAARRLAVEYEEAVLECKHEVVVDVHMLYDLVEAVKGCA